MIKRHFISLMMLGIALFLMIRLPVRITRAQNPCPNNTPTLLTQGNSGQTLAPAVLHQDLNPSGGAMLDPTSPVVSHLDAGAIFQVLDGPNCVGSSVWWRIQSEIGTRGWIAETDANGPVVEPLNGAVTNSIATQSPAPTPIPLVAPPNEQGFAVFNPGQVDVIGHLPADKPGIDLSNVIVGNLLNPDQRKLVAQNEFVVSTEKFLEFDSAYKDTYNLSAPILITTDSLLHHFHLAFDSILQHSEQQHFLPLLRDINKALLAQANSIYQACKGSDWENAAKRVVMYAGVSSQLADPSASVPDYVRDAVMQEVTNVNVASGSGLSAVFSDLQEDWTQYIPRGHYTKTDDLKAYFRAMMYFGRMTFRLKYPDETRSAVLLIAALHNATVDGVGGLDAWRDLYDPTVFFVGYSDDLTVLQYLPIMQQAYGANLDMSGIQKKGIDEFIGLAKALPPPQINGTLTQNAQNLSEDTKGLRFMGQRFVWDAYAFSQLMYQNVGTPDKRRNLPMALDIFAVMGSDRAMQILDQAGATSYANYSTQMDKLRTAFSAQSESDRTNTLYNAWLYAQNTLTQPVPDGYPSFMRGPAYADRQLYAALGSFAELKHDTALYAKQPEAPGGGGGGCSELLQPVAQPNYVEPLPLFWARLAALAEMTDAGLGSRHLLSPNDAAVLRQIAHLARRFEHDSQIELKGELLSAQEQSDLSNYYYALQAIHYLTADMAIWEMIYIDPFYFANEAPHAALIADIATDPNAGQVLEIGTGDVFNIYAVVPIGGKLYLERGAVSSYYEFTHPMSDRLTDAKWQTILGQPPVGSAMSPEDPEPTPDPTQMPPLPIWTKRFIAQGSAESGLQAGIKDFQDILTYTLDSQDFNYPETQDQIKTAGRPKGDGAAHYIFSLSSPLEGKDIGHLLLSQNFGALSLSADGKTATVHSQETYWDGLYKGGGYGCGDQLAERGPYTLKLTYTLKYVLEPDQRMHWMVDNVSDNGAYPAWKYLPAQPTPTAAGN